MPGKTREPAAATLMLSPALPDCACAGTVAAMNAASPTESIENFIVRPLPLGVESDQVVPARA
jgi:hypothetical protein